MYLHGKIGELIVDCLEHGLGDGPQPSLPAMLGGMLLDRSDPYEPIASPVALEALDTAKRILTRYVDPDPMNPRTISAEERRALASALLRLNDALVIEAHKRGASEG